MTAPEKTPEALRDEVLADAAWMTTLRKRDMYQREEYSALLQIIDDMPGRPSS